MRCASFLSSPQKTCTMLIVAVVTGSEKSPPGGETAPTIVTEPSRSGEPKHRTRPEKSAALQKALPHLNSPSSSARCLSVEKFGSASTQGCVAPYSRVRRSSPGELPSRPGIPSPPASPPDAPRFRAAPPPTAKYCRPSSRRGNPCLGSTPPK